MTVAAVGRGYPKTAVTTVTAVTPKDGHPPKERRNPPMPYAILRFQKRKAGGVAACERHNERKKEAYKRLFHYDWLRQDISEYLEEGKNKEEKKQRS